MKDENLKEEIKTNLFKHAKMINRILRRKVDLTKLDIGQLSIFCHDYLHDYLKSKRRRLMEIKETKEEQIIRRMFKEIYDLHFDSVAMKESWTIDDRPPVNQLVIDIGYFIQGKQPLYYEHMKKKWKRSLI